jgi:hypothetical protein
MIVEDAVRDAFAEIGQQAAEQPVQAHQMSTAIRYLNRFMAAFAYLELGYVAVDSSSDTIVVPSYAEEWVVLKLATKLAASFPSTEQLSTIVANEREAYNNLLIQQPRVCPQDFPSTLPVGSGNECVFGDRFYCGVDEEFMECQEDDE